MYFEALAPHKATGIDGIGPRKPLHYLYIISLCKCMLPLEWCIHCIVPVSGDKTTAKNYHPISLLCRDWPIMLIFFTYYAMLQCSYNLPIMLKIMLKNKYYA